MATIQLWNGKILVRHGKIAVGPACCCEAPTVACDCNECDIQEEMIARWSGVSCTLQKYSFSEAPPGDCTASYNPEIGTPCPTSEDGMRIYEIQLYCNLPDYPGRWTITVYGLDQNDDTWHGTIELPAEACIVPGKYDVEIFYYGTGASYGIIEIEIPELPEP